MCSVTPSGPHPYARAEQLEREITELCAHLNAATFRLLQLIVELDEQEPWGAWGLMSCAHWLNWRCGIGLNAAREKVRVAHALKALPVISAAFESGELSYSKVRALTRVATGANEDYLLMIARYGTAAQVEKLVRLYRGVERAEEREHAERQQAERALHYFYDENGDLVIRVKLPPAQGAVVVKAIEAAVAALQEDERADGTGEPSTAPETGVTAVTSMHWDTDPFAQRRADGLTLMAETLLRTGARAASSAECYQVMVHVTAETLRAQPGGRCELEGGPALGCDTARRLACDSARVEITEDAYGNPLDIGRKTRAIPPGLQRALRARDGGCRFPGCTRRRYVDAHHIVHWADGGATRIDNLVQLCRHHHRLMHEGGLDVTRNADGTFTFMRPNGAVIENSPPLPRAAGVAGLRNLNRQAGVPGDSTRWVIPGERMDYDMAIDGLVQLREAKTTAVSTEV